MGESAYGPRMGFRDDVALARQQKLEAKEVRKTAASNDGLHYLVSVNKGSVNVEAWQQRLNEAWHNGWRLHTALEQDGNTIQILERRD